MREGDDRLPMETDLLGTQLGKKRASWHWPCARRGCGEEEGEGERALGHLTLSSRRRAEAKKWTSRTREECLARLGEVQCPPSPPGFRSVSRSVCKGVCRSAGLLVCQFVYRLILCPGSVYVGHYFCL